MKQAFPIFENSGSGMELTDTGMTLRDYFAAKAMQGGIAHNRPVADPEGWAKWAYKVADAMMNARGES